MNKSGFKKTKFSSFVNIKMIRFYQCFNIKMTTCFVFMFSVVFAETVHFTNSQTQLERSSSAQYAGRGLRTYQLDVPGSSPITIVEAEPWKGDEDRQGRSMSRDSSARNYSDRRTKDYVVPGSTHEKDLTHSYAKESESSKCFGPLCDNDLNKKTVFSPELINKFLKEYADNIKNADQRIKDRLKQMEITTTDGNFDIITADKIYEKDHASDKMDFKLQQESNRRLSQWGESDKPKHPYEDPEGWVALEAVPWTRSKISKWQANAYKINKPPSNNNHLNSFVGDRDPPVNNDRFSTNYGNIDPDYNNYQEKPVSSYYNFPKPALNNERPQYEPSPVDNDWSSETPSRPSWAKPSNNRPHQYESETDRRPQPQPRPNCEHEHHHQSDNRQQDEDTRRISSQYYNQGGIITDGKHAGFPSNGYKKKDMQYQRPTEVSYAEELKLEHPLSHPSNGNGQWVLLSTTKGYKIPKNRQRSLSITPNSLTSHRTVRLTVLPAVNGSKENMTLSHGGLLEVEPSFHTVDESRRLYERSQRINSTTSKPKKKRRIVATNATPDSSAVMAAVGAGLVPATVAMIMPMVLGRKKRSLFKPELVNFAYFQNVTQHPHFDFESTLQRTL